MSSEPESIETSETEGAPSNPADDIGVAIFLVMAGPVLAFVPLYFGLKGFWAGLFVVLAMLSLSFAFMGAGIELSKPAFADQGVWEDLGFATGFAILAAMFHFGVLASNAGPLLVAAKIAVVLMMILSVAFLGMALGHVLVDARSKPSTDGRKRPASWPALLGAFLIWLTTVALNVAQILKLLSK